ncbi:MAG: hypothetical protein SFY66_03440 [Oculatellaceae cyanobacterium bins.114]|nr:hypothetical protein [Oculatellaceae cyanobacterium bins.114]
MKNIQYFCATTILDTAFFKDRQDYLISTELTLIEQTWLVDELKGLLNHLQHRVVL